MFRLLLPLVVASACSEYDVLTDTREQPFTEVFEVRGARTDVLFFADNSFSMQRELITLGSSFQRFLRRMDGAEDDWQVIAVTGPDGCANTGILTAETPDYVARFAEGVQTPPGEDDVDEWGLFNARQAVLNAAPGRCNEGFLRDGAVLHVVFLSDEADSSPGHEVGGDYWRDYVDAIVYAKGDPEYVRFSAIVGPLPSGCEGADPGHGYVDAAEATGGEVLSICGDWSAEMEILADASITQDTFPLAREPLLDSLRVQVNGEDREGGWHYDAAGQAIVFTADLPRGRDEVVVHYRAWVEVVVEEGDAA